MVEPELHPTSSPFLVTSPPIPFLPVGISPGSHGSRLPPQGIHSWVCTEAVLLPGYSQSVTECSAGVSDGVFI